MLMDVAAAKQPHPHKPQKFTHNKQLPINKINFNNKQSLNPQFQNKKKKLSIKKLITTHLIN